MKYLNLLLFSVVLLFSVISCERIPQPPEDRIEVIKTEVNNADYIPLEYGKLVSVTSGKAGIVQLWFEDDNRNIRLVHFTYAKDYMDPVVKIIKRK